MQPDFTRASYAVQTSKSNAIRLFTNTNELNPNGMAILQDGVSDSSSNGSRARNNPASDYSEGAGHVLTIIHQILNHHRVLENRWHRQKIKLHQKLALRLFQEDVKQVSTIDFSKASLKFGSFHRFDGY